MKQSLVSIIIPCYNAEAYVGDAIRSALDQTHPDCEVIVIDDGSSDQSLEVIRSFGDAVIWESGMNHGGCAARNRGLALAKGCWVQFLDADDILEPGCVEAKYSASVVTDECVCTRVEAMDGATLPAHWFMDSYDLNDIFEHGSPQTGMPLHLRENLIKVGGFRYGLPCAQEFDLHMRLAMMGGIRFKTLGEVGLRIRPTPHSVSRTAGIRMSKTMARVMIDGLHLLRGDEKKFTRSKESFVKGALTIARRLWRQGARAEALELAQVAKSLSPENWTHLGYRNHVAATAARLLGFAQYEKLHGVFAKK